MIKVDIKTMEASREAVPRELHRLAVKTLQNLQTDLNPVPDHLIDIEYWPEEPVELVYDVDTHRPGPEILTPDPEAKVVLVSWELVALTEEERAANLAEAQTRKSLEIERHAAGLRNEIVANVSPAEMASWPIKEAEAVKYRELGLDEAAPLLQTEAQHRGVTLADLVARVEANSLAFRTAEAQIAGVSGKHRDAVAALTLPSEVVAYDYSTGWPG